jgi:hypothetical protein
MSKRHHIEWKAKLLVCASAAIMMSGAVVDHLHKRYKPTPVVHAAEPQRCPSRLLVGSYVYELVAGDPGISSAGKPYGGITNFQRQVIVIDPELPRDLKKETIVHELEHIAASQGMQRSADYFKHHKYRDEQWIEATAPILTLTLRRYPELLTCDLK